MLTDDPRSAPRGPRPRMRLLPAPLALALALHVALLTSAESPVAPGAAMTVSMQVRAVDTWQAPASVQAPAPAAAGTIAAPVPAPRHARTGASTPAARAPGPLLRSVFNVPAAPAAPGREADGVAPPGREADGVAAQGREAEGVAAPGREADGTAAPRREAQGVAASPDMTVPVYRTRVPPSTTLRYELRKGELAGSGELSWKTDGEHYEARLEGRVAGLPVATQTSSGALDANGIAPLRYTDARLRRGALAANFQRDKGTITYSGPPAEFALVDGAQDRLSWMLQIAAVLNAEPQRGAPGEQITLFVSGASGDADVWVFHSAGPETVATPSGALRAVKFTRAARHAHDPTVDVWLAPSLGHLPVRARFSAAEAPPFEWLLREMPSP